MNDLELFDYIKSINSKEQITNDLLKHISGSPQLSEILASNYYITNDLKIPFCLKSEIHESSETILKFCYNLVKNNKKISLDLPERMQLCKSKELSNFIVRCRDFFQEDYLYGEFISKLSENPFDALYVIKEYYIYKKLSIPERLFNCFLDNVNLLIYLNDYVKEDDFPQTFLDKMAKCHELFYNAHKNLLYKDLKERFPKTVEIRENLLKDFYNKFIDKKE